MSASPTNAQPCPDIGKGWLVQTIPRKTGNHIDRYWYSPCGRRFRSRPEVDRFLQSKTTPKPHVKHALGGVISKYFPGEGGDCERSFKGKITSYDPVRKLYKIVYEDDDEEEMSEGEIDELIDQKKKEKKRKSSAKSGEYLSKSSIVDGIAAA